MMHCPNCNLEVQADDVYCENCGFVLPENQATSSKAQREEYQLDTGVGSWRTIKWMIVGVAVVFSLGVLCGGLAFPRVFEKKVAQHALQVVTATPTPTPKVTPGPSPTPTETSTPTPTSTPIPTTVPGTVLQRGQPWYEDGLEIWMDAVLPPQPDHIKVTLYLINHREQAEPLRLQGNEFRMVSNLGHTVNLYGWTGGEHTVGPGEQFALAREGSFKYDFANQEVKWIVVEVTGLLTIERAQWKVEIRQ